MRHSDEVDAADPASQYQYLEVELQEESSTNWASGQGSTTLRSKSSLIGQTNLVFNPRQTKIFNFAVPLREAGDIRAKSAELSMTEELFDVEYVVLLDAKTIPGEWWIKDSTRVRKQKTGRGTILSTKAHPKPPRMHLLLINMKDQYYTGEQITVSAEVLNEEDEETEAALEVRILGDGEEPADITWIKSSDLANPRVNDAVENSTDQDQGDDGLPGHRMGRLAPTAKRVESFSFSASSRPVEYIVEVKVLYYQLSDLETPLSRTLTASVVAVAPFEVSYDFSPRLHPAPWPNYFQAHDEGDLEQTSDSQVLGLSQRWCLSTVLASAGTEELFLEAGKLELPEITGNITCSVKHSTENSTLPTRVSRDDPRQLSFILDVQRLSLEDRRSVTLDVTLDISWKRPGNDSQLISTSLSIPRLLIPGGEPRVLASVQYSKDIPSLIHLDYTIENPSMRLLTFSLVMEPNDDFAFYGHKVSSLQLVPLSRHTVRFNLFPMVRGAWIQPQLKVVDKYFNKILRIVATEGMKMDRKGILVWVNADG